MPTATAQQIRDRKVIVTIPGTDLQIECRRPDPLDLIARGILPLDTYATVLENVSAWANTPAATPGGNVLETVRQAPETYADFVDRWVCAAAVTPAVVATEAEATQQPAAIWVDDLDLDIKFEILRRTNHRLASSKFSATVKEWLQRRSAGAGDRPDGAAVRDAAVEVVGRA